MKEINTIKSLLKKIYGAKKGEVAFNKLFSLIKSFQQEKNKKKGSYFSQEDIILITYGDSLSKKDEAPLKTLYDFVNGYLKGVFSTIHILPFFPYSSDDGFSIVDYFKVNPELGTWKEIKLFNRNFKLMFDLVLNHISSKNIWFKKYLDEEKEFKNLAIEIDPSVDLSSVVRPRALPLLTEIKKNSGKKVYIWTTFSSDQIDLNYKSITVLEKMIEVLLYYVKQGAGIIRLDAIGYLWKEIGTKCIHLIKTHDIVKLFRKILDLVAPDILLITETNVPHRENISYFGDGYDEAQMVYNFTLPPLLFYSFTMENATKLNKWAKTLEIESKSNTFLNFTASHDGIGIYPLEGILSGNEIDKLIKIVKKNGGYISYKKNPDGSESPYEFNITYIDALMKNNKADMYLARRFLASQAIKFVLPGVPATYINSLLGSRNWLEGYKNTNIPRKINREKFRIDDLLSELKEKKSFRSKIFFPYLELVKIRREQKAFHPNSAFKVIEINPKVFSILRSCEDQIIYSLTNISSVNISISLAGEKVPANMKNLLTGEKMNTDSFILNPYQFVWLSNINE